MRLLSIMVGVLLASTGAAYACWFHSGSLKSVSATFTATTVNGLQSSTCTGNDGGSYTASEAEYTGTATSTEPTLNGSITIDAKSVVDTTTGVGIVDGSLKIAGSSGTTSSMFDAVYANGTLTGFAGGRGDDNNNDHSSVLLLANLNSAFSATGGFTNGQLGGPTSNGGGAVEVTRGDCRTTPATPPVPSEWIDVHGNVSAVSSTSITAAGVTCAVPASLAASMGGYNIGDAVFMQCQVSGGTTTLDKITSGGDFHGHDVFRVHAGDKLKAAFQLHFGLHHSFRRHHK